MAPMRRLVRGAICALALLSACAEGSKEVVEADDTDSDAAVADWQTSPLVAIDDGDVVAVVLSASTSAQVVVSRGNVVSLEHPTEGLPPESIFGVQFPQVLAAATNGDVSVVVGWASGQPLILRRSAGGAWEPAPLGPESAGLQLSDVARVGQGFLAVGGRPVPAGTFTFAPVALASPDGQVWSEIAIPEELLGYFDSSFSSVATDGAMVVLAGGTAPLWAPVDDLTAWSVASVEGAPADAQRSVIGFDDGGFALYGTREEGDGPHAELWRSPPGEMPTFTPVDGAPERLRGMQFPILAAVGSRLVVGSVVGEQVSIHAHDGTAWEEIAGPPSGGRAFSLKDLSTVDGDLAIVASFAEGMVFARLSVT